VLWSVAHIYFLIGFRRRMIVALHWAWSYITLQRGTRLITGLRGSQTPASADEEGPRRSGLRGAA
jgi:NADH dehydrogenase